ncbi:MAG TPA: alanine--tRNA ligase, partial [Gammaproteobacteria bacterium]|nr:alanine--tRNA ligase [Gammaproteobacteria bacterium]
MNTAELRTAFLNYFHALGHTVVPSSSLVPTNDPTLLFTNAGMNQFKDMFLGLETRDYTRATSSQRCVRAGGKHNDLENVGFTARHHTFFEMLGNFSFGDYFKREAIKYAWDFVTKVLKLPPERLWITIYKDDDEAADIWLHEIKIDPRRFSRCGEKDNFWAMGDTGPCGPCSEIFYDHGPEIAGGPPGSPDADGDRYIEIWNLVFMQYNRDANGDLNLLPKPSVDTGMGLERVAAIMQGVHNNYDIDLFKNIINGIIKMYHIKDVHNKSLRVVADHLRACAFLVADGVIPSNEGRGYVLRRIMRRAIRHGHKLGVNKIFFHTLVPLLVKEMGQAFPELVREQKNIEKVFEQEEQQFAKTIDQGLKIVEQAIEDMTGTVIPGATVFMLYDTYGFPVDLTADIAREHNFTVDIAGFEQAMAEQRTRARKASQFSAKQQGFVAKTTSEFTGYERVSDTAKVVELFKDGQAVEQLLPNETGFVVLDRTPFYAEAGGQVGDIGVITGKGIEFVVIDTTKNANANVHYGENLGSALHVGDKVEARVEEQRRIKIKANHSATHLLHAALRKILGAHVQQKGSVVDDQRLRFDFAHGAPLTETEIFAVEKLVNEKIQANLSAEIKIMSTQEAMNTGAMALFGEKYGDKVRVLTMGQDFSVELCGGTHTTRTGDIGFFKIVSESGIAAGIRRIEAITGMTAVDWVQSQEKFIHGLSDTMKTAPAELESKLQQINGKLKTLEKQNAKLQAELASGGSRDILQEARDIKGVKVIAAMLPAGDAKSLREA